MLEKCVPVCSFKIWGGTKLAKAKNIKIEGALGLGETWEVSTHREGTSLLGPHHKKLSELFMVSYLVKFIDTSEHLSIQVHPGDDYARLHENDSGKTECWIILEAEEGAGIFLGLRAGVTKERLETALKNQEKINELLNFIPVKRGDYFMVYSGSIHAIGKGVTLAEIQQSSGITYRVWDWNRLENGKPRTLHVKKSLDVLEFDPIKNTLNYFQHQSDLFQFESEGTKVKVLAKEKDFSVSLYVMKATKIEINLENKKTPALVCLHGCGKLETAIGDKSIMEAYTSFVVAHNQNIEIDVASECIFLLIE